MPDPLHSQGPHGRLIAWMLSRDTGLSSLVMARTLGPLIGYRGPFRDDPPDTYPHHPVDAYDFGRCVKLLDVVPELREHIPAVAALSASWAAIVADWDELESIYRLRGRPGLSRRIRRILETMYAI